MVVVFVVIICMSSLPGVLGTLKGSRVPVLGDEPSEVEDDSEDDVEGVMTGDPKETTVEGETVNGDTQGDDG